MREKYFTYYDAAMVRARGFFAGVDWYMLIFLIGFINVKLIVKLAAIIFIYIRRSNFSFGFSYSKSRLPLFYPIAAAIALVNLCLWRWYQMPNYLYAFGLGILFWMLCILAVNQSKHWVETTSTTVIHRTILMFFVVNGLVSIGDLVAIIWETGALNPYRYQGMFQKYFMGTGDYIKGISLDTSTTNAIINSAGIFYFLYRRNILAVLGCMIVLLLTASNFTNIVTLAVVVGIFCFKTTRNEKTIISLCIFLLAIFLAKISPQNVDYSLTTFKAAFTKQDTGMNGEGQTAAIHVRDSDEIRREYARKYLDSLKKLLEANARLGITFETSHNSARTQVPSVVGLSTQSPGSHPVRRLVNRPKLPEADINSFEYQSSKDTTAHQLELIHYALDHRSTFEMTDKTRFLPGKAVALEQTIQLFRRNPKYAALGIGMGNFSSKLAFRTTALNIDGSYPERHQYINPEFANNHLALYFYFFTRRKQYHSVVNTSDSVYDQLLSEYGVMGLLAFVVFYLLYFARRYRQMTYGIPLFILLLAACAIGYWFEQLSVLVILELLLFIDINANELKIHDTAENHGM